MAPSVATFNQVSAASGNNIKERFRHQAKLQSGEEARPHFERFFLVGSALLMYLAVKLNIFFGKFNWAEDHMELNFGKNMM